MRFLRRRSLVAVCITTLVLMINAGIASYSLFRIDQAQNQIQAAYAFDLDVAQLFSLLQDAETGQRGFLLSRSEAYLAPYSHAVQSIQQEVGLLDAAGRAPSLSPGHIATLQALIDQKLDELAQTIALSHQGDHEGAIAMVQSGRGKQLMDAIREEIASIQQEQATYLQVEVAAIHQRSLLAQVSLLVALALSIVLLGSLAVLMERSMRERLQAAAQLAHERSVLHATISSIGDGLIATDIQGQVTFMNAVAEHLTGWLQAEAHGQALEKVFTIISESTRQPTESPVSKVLRSGMVAGLANHTLLIAKDGTERPIDDSGAPIHDAQRQLLGVVLVFRDITERYAAEAALRQSEARYRALADTIASLVFSMDADGEIFYFNQPFYDYTGLQGQAPSRALWLRLIHPADRPGLLQAWEQARRSGEALVAEHRLRRADGVYRWFLSRIIPTPHADVGAAGWFGSCTDIDDQRVAADHEHFLAEASYTLARTTNYELALDTVARLAVPSVADMCVIQLLDDQGVPAQTIVAHSDPDKAALIQPLQLMRLMPLGQGEPLWRAQLVPYVTDMVTEHSELSPFIRELSQQIEPRSLIFTPMHIRHQPLGGVLLAIDTTERSYGPSDLHMAEELARRLSLGIDNARLFREAQTAITVRDEFLSIASHELRTPLTALLGYAEMLQRRVEENPAFQERDRYAVRVMLMRIEHLYKMVSSMLDLSRLQSQQLMIEYSVVRICKLVDRVIHEAQVLPGRSRIAFAGCDQDMLIEGDEVRLEQVFQNLLENALKYSSDPDPVTITVEDHGSHVLVSVADQGIGIPKEDLPQLFQRFYRASNIDGRRVSGMGLGLYVVKEIVSLHHGTITVTSEEGKGSTFVVRLPKAAPAQERLA
ncbi:PAS domain S-box protein [Chloroflexia bacterium SDU3-3]|nr:PAS domain S-box protein [Chloroflexia bacterium SDU3-3]